MLCPVNKQPPHLGGYYFQQRTKGPSKYITALSPGRWERWRGGLGDGANRCPRAVDVADRCANDPPPPPRRLGAGPQPGADFQSCAGEDPDPNRGWAHIHDGAA
jgi:hypothetical protein